MKEVRLINGDCLIELKGLDDNSVDSVVTDPPYELGFMGKAWDSSGIAFNVDVWKECLRVLKPGGHILAFGGTRTYHRMTVAIEDAGFQIRDCIAWMYGSGFPKSHNIGKSIDKLQGNEREVVGPGNSGRDMTGGSYGNQSDKQPMTFDVTKGNSQWEGWGTSLKPAFEPVVMGRKPFKGTVVDNVLEYGTGGINIDECRIGSEGGTKKSDIEKVGDVATNFTIGKQNIKNKVENIGEGRWPANVILDEEAGKILDEQSGKTKSTKWKKQYNSSVSETFGGGNKNENNSYGDEGGASRFFYCPKASKQDRNEDTTLFGLHPTIQHERVETTLGRWPANVMLDEEAGKILDEQSGTTYSGPTKPKKDYSGGVFGGGNSPIDYHANSGGASRFFYCPKASKKDRNEGLDNIHPTVKPTALMEYLIRLVTPKGGIVLDPFMGSGSTGKGAVLNDNGFIGIELSPEYFLIAESRIKSVSNKIKFWS